MSRGKVIDGAQGMVKPQVLEDAKLRTMLGGLFANVGLLTGTVGTIMNRAVTVQDLVDLGLIVQKNDRLYVPETDAASFSSYSEYGDNATASSNFEMDVVDHDTGEAIHIVVENGKCRKIV